MSYKDISGAADGLTDAVMDSGREFLDYDPVGLPDRKDIQNINIIIRNHEKAHPGEIHHYVQAAKKAREEVALNPWMTGFKNADNTRRRVLTMPIGLMREIEESYPLMFRNRQHLEWFRKTYPAFDTSGAQ